eukprot:CAMPEP_0172486346 /NCGR_PEP_ID=MMETSP1066-20121228/14906_1 /TAXON_ID=671091 /ORGANISM="Coscinodiscus wailesii, Strain CCMP2513" /LENGTH=126 /DNA_ID=CAMNT_0013252249 /DNA_START=870 /DNA_END=1250 /DNA_ORIENTATION=-
MPTPGRPVAPPMLLIPTSQRILQLPLEQIHDNRLVPPQVVLPREHGVVVVVRPVTILLLDVRTFVHAVEIFMDAVEEKREEFLRVMLEIALELGGEVLQFVFEQVRVRGGFFAQPHFLQEVGVGRG